MPNIIAEKQCSDGTYNYIGWPAEVTPKDHNLSINQLCEYICASNWLNNEDKIVKAVTLLVYELSPSLYVKITFDELLGDYEIAELTIIEYYDTVNKINCS